MALAAIPQPAAAHDEPVVGSLIGGAFDGNGSSRVHRDDRTRVASRAVAKPKMKKVCRYVPVKRNTAATSYGSGG